MLRPAASPQIIVLILAIVFNTCAFAENLVLVNGTIIDGTGNPRIAGNVRIHDGEITAIGPFKILPGETTIDVKKMIIAPGFINIRSKSPDSQVSRGITTQVMGQNGTGPIAVEDFMQPFDSNPPVPNLALFIGHATVRVHEMEEVNQPATPERIQRMVRAVEYGMREGAFGLSVALDQEPGLYATTDELVDLAKVTVRYGGIFTMTLRDSAKVLDSIKEAIDIARRAKSPVHISGLSGTPTEILPLLDQARTQKLDVTADVTSASKNLLELLKNRNVMVADGDTFPVVLASKALTLESTIRKMTGQPAERLGLKERGTLKKGNAADIVVFDPATAGSGMNYVFVNGLMVIKEGQPTGATPGQALR